jgi:membrane-bound lytic murein transglycosylase MltF
LKTSREYGFGLGQVTVTDKFNAFTEEQRLDPSLKNWQWNDRYDPQMQLRGLVLKDRQLYNLILGVASDVDHLAFAFAAYNGGLGGVLSDRRVCAATPHCDQRIWFDNVEHTSLKARVKVGGYGQSFFDINREYVRNILLVRSQKYRQFFKE